eukprot:NODE_12044_length_1249_cov_3.277184.p1 GENE.NODE_12044_length_1249_cov_3.277184~~NODE_12044_length_1249_cov_3.277184.p1  ORF type:complete len:254 (-),score=36.74 NODE_12044_length_1249_cov_3.277184:373-1134(-)
MFCLCHPCVALLFFAAAHCAQQEASCASSGHCRASDTLKREESGPPEQAARTKWSQRSANGHVTMMQLGQIKMLLDDEKDPVAESQAQLQAAPQAGISVTAAAMSEPRFHAFAGILSFTGFQRRLYDSDVSLAVMIGGCVCIVFLGLLLAWALYSHFNVDVAASSPKRSSGKAPWRTMDSDATDLNGTQQSLAPSSWQKEGRSQSPLGPDHANKSAPPTGAVEEVQPEHAAPAKRKLLQAAAEPCVLRADIGV